MIKSLLLTASLVLSLSVWAENYEVESHHGNGNGNGTGTGQPANPGVSPGQSNQEQCDDHGQPMSINNTQVLQWKTSKPNGFLARGYIQGSVDDIFADLTGHHHFSVKIGSGPQDHVEVIYQLNFGAMPEPKLGDQVTACGDFINSYAQNNGYQPSPDGAIVHWVHRSPSSSHDSGFVILNGTLYGFGN